MLHAVEHPGHRQKRLGSVVKALAAPKQLEQRDAPCGKEQISPGDDQEHRHEEIDQGIQGMVDGQGEEVSCAEAGQSQQGQEPAGFGLPLPHRLGLEQLPGIGPAHLAHPVGQKHQEQGTKELEGG